MRPAPKVVYSAEQLSAEVARLGRAISEDYGSQTLHVVAILENAFIFASDLVRAISCPTVCHFVRAKMRDIQLGGFDRREIFFSDEPDLTGRHVLLVDTVLHSGVTMDFFAKRLQESRPHSVRMAVLVNKPHDRKVDFVPDYVGFEVASKYLVGYGLPGRDGLYRNLPYIGTPVRAGRGAAGSRARAARKSGKKAKRTR